MLVLLIPIPCPTHTHIANLKTLRNSMSQRQRRARIYFADHAAFYIIFKKKPKNLTAVSPEPRFELEDFLERVGKAFKFMRF